MNKRAKQIALLQKIDKWNTYYNYNQLVQIVYNGIVKRYKKTPIQVLNLIYNKASVSGISGVEELTIEILPDEAELEKLSTYKDSKGNIYDSKTDQMIKDANGNIKTQNKNIWKDISSVIEFLVKILKSLGINFGNSSSTPNPGDWGNAGYGNGNETKEADIAGSLPIVVGGVILYYLFSTAGKKSGKSKSKK